MKHKLLLTISIITTIIVALIACMDAAPVVDARGKAYAGAASCASCHKNIHENFLHSEHAHTSWAVNELPKDILHNDSFAFSPTSFVRIEKRDSGMYQVAYADGRETIARKFDIGFGSGEKAFTFGYWQDRKLNQLPLSYFKTIGQWANSPGFPARRAYFDRPIIRRCFECHSSYIAADVKQTESLSNVRTLDASTVIYGIDCERCHGPAAEHVNFHQKNPNEKQAQHIASWKTLSRDQRMDVCGVCHSGNDLQTQFTTFAFRPGDTLSKFFYPEFGGNTPSPDVHGKQVQLLSASQCFIKSSAMECTTCHSPHNASPSQTTVYVQQCQQCHQDIKHKDVAITGDLLTSKCIDCHMPSEASRIIGFRQQGNEQVSTYFLRTHRIAVYPEETQKIISLIKSK